MKSKMPVNYVSYSNIHEIFALPSTPSDENKNKLGERNMKIG